MTLSPRRFSLIVLGFVLASLTAGRRRPGPARGHAPRAEHGAVGHDDLQGRSAYSTDHPAERRFIAYVGHHVARLASVDAAEEDNGTSVVDVTDPARPRYLVHIPGMPGGPEAGGAQMARVCDRQGKTYLLRTFATRSPLGSPRLGRDDRRSRRK